VIWDTDTINRLRYEWALGTATAEIGRKLGVSKNAIVGKAHRLDLDSRPSPIQRGSESLGRSPTTRRLPQSLPPLPSLQDAAPAPAPAPRPAPVIQAIRLPVEPKPLPPVRPIVRRAPRECCWPIGEPGKPAFRFCGGPAELGRPYCDEHSKLAYARVRDRKEDLI
jgi:GcrA cell cycle regulator